MQLFISTLHFVYLSDIVFARCVSKSLPAMITLYQNVLVKVLTHFMRKFSDALVLPGVVKLSEAIVLRCTKEVTTESFKDIYNNNV